MGGGGEEDEPAAHANGSLLLEYSNQPQQRKNFVATLFLRKILARNIFLKKQTFYLYQREQVELSF